MPHLSASRPVHFLTSALSRLPSIRHSAPSDPSLQSPRRPLSARASSHCGPSSRWGIALLRCPRVRGPRHPSPSFARSPYPQYLHHHAQTSLPERAPRADCSGTTSPPSRLRQSRSRHRPLPRACDQRRRGGLSAGCRNHQERSPRTGEA